MNRFRMALLASIAFAPVAFSPAALAEAPPSAAPTAEKPAVTAPADAAPTDAVPAIDAATAPKAEPSPADRNRWHAELAQTLQAAVDQMASNGRLAAMFDRANVTWRPV